jgi:hypothetical protein
VNVVKVVELRSSLCTNSQWLTIRYHISEEIVLGYQVLKYRNDVDNVSAASKLMVTVKRNFVKSVASA